MLSVMKVLYILYGVHSCRWLALLWLKAVGVYKVLEGAGRPSYKYLMIFIQPLWESWHTD